MLDMDDIQYYNALSIASALYSGSERDEKLEELRLIRSRRWKARSQSNESQLITI